MDLSQTTGVVEPVTLAGKEYPVRLLTLEEWGKIHAWVKKAHPSPVTRALMAIQEARELGQTIARETQDDMLDHAYRAALSWPPRLGSIAWFDAIDNAEDGQARLLFDVLVKADAAFTFDAAKTLAPTFSNHDWNELLRVALYGEHPGPKAPAASGDEK